MRADFLRLSPDFTPARSRIAIGEDRVRYVSNHLEERRCIDRINSVGAYRTQGYRSWDSVTGGGRRESLAWLDKDHHSCATATGTGVARPGGS